MFLECDTNISDKFAILNNSNTSLFDDEVKFGFNARQRFKQQLNQVRRFALKMVIGFPCGRIFGIGL